MYCRNCGKQQYNSEKFCISCGLENDCFVSNNGFNTDLVNSKKSEKRMLIIIFGILGLFVFGIIGLVVIIFFFVFSIMNTIQMEEYVSFNKDKISSIYSVVGEKKLCSVNSSEYNGEHTIIYEYCDYSLTINEFNVYKDYLIENENFKEIDSYEDVLIVKESVESGMIIEVIIDYDSFTIIYGKKFGNLEVSEEDNQL